MENGYLYETFNAMLRRDSAARDDTYLTAPLYYILTGRRGLRIHEGYGAVMAVCTHPHADGRLLVFPEIGSAGGRLAASVLAALEPPPGGVQLARFDETSLAALKNALSMRNDARIDSFRKIAEPLMDWRYPVHLLDTARVAKLEGSAFARIRNKCRQVEGSTLAVPLHEPQAARMMRAAHRYWEGSMLMRGHDSMDLTGYYATLFAMTDEWPDRFGGLVYVQGRRPVGFTVFDRPHRGVSNLLANVADASVTGLADYQIVTTCRALSERGAGSLNFGGSETESLDLFKRKFMPYKTLPLLSAEIVYTSRQDPHVRSGPLLTAFTAA